MDSEKRLSDRQRHRAAGLAREKGLTCPDCGASDPVPREGDEALARRPDGGADVAMGCLSCESASEMTLVLSPEEAKALGLHALRDRPEKP
jgi:hypothetical protein